MSFIFPEGFVCQKWVRFFFRTSYVPVADFIRDFYVEGTNLFVRLYLVYSSFFEIRWDERVETPPQRCFHAVGEIGHRVVV